MVRKLVHTARSPGSIPGCHKIFKLLIKEFVETLYKEMTEERNKRK